MTMKNKDLVFRSDNRETDQLRQINITPDFIRTAEGSALIEVGNTRWCSCTASIEESVPSFMKGSGNGWITPNTACSRAPLTRSPREAAKGRQGERTHEIQRLIGRALRAAVT